MMIPNLYLGNGWLFHQTSLQRWLFRVSGRGHFLFQVLSSRTEAGFFASFFSLPFDFVKTQMQKQKKDPTTGQAKRQDDIGEETRIAYIHVKRCLNALFYIEFDEKEQ